MTHARVSGAVWITWESQPRNRSMARELGAELHEVIDRGPRLRRYGRSVIATLRILRRTRPRVVCAPNPSLVLTCLLLSLRPFFRFRLVSDAHYGGVKAVSGSRWLQRVLSFVNRRVDVVIVTNDAHARFIESLGGKPAVCPDPLPDLPALDRSWTAADWAGTRREQKTVLFICSFDPDEPFAAVFAAAPALAARGFRLIVSGNYRKAGLEAEAVSGVRLLGYVDRHSYYQHLLRADVLLDLTTFEDCLVCGAYEAMAAGTPCVLSNSVTLRRYFTEGAVFTTHDADAIARAVIDAYERRDALRAGIEQWRVSNRAHMLHCIAKLGEAAALSLPRYDLPSAPVPAPIA